MQYPLAKQNHLTARMGRYSGFMSYSSGFVQTNDFYLKEVSGLRTIKLHHPLRAFLTAGQFGNEFDLKKGCKGTLRIIVESDRDNQGMMSVVVNPGAYVSSKPDLDGFPQTEEEIKSKEKWDSFTQCIGPPGSGAILCVPFEVNPHNSVEPIKSSPLNINVLDGPYFFDSYDPDSTRFNVLRVYMRVEDMTFDR